MSLAGPSSSIIGRRVVLLACGAFDPPTYAHLRILERSRDFLERSLCCRVVEGIVCPFGDSEGVERTAARHRMRMVEAALRRSRWIRAGDWSCSQTGHVRQMAALKHYQKESQQKHGADVRVVVVCGSDVMQNFAHIDHGKCSWNQDELSYLLTHHALVVLKRGRHPPSHIVYLMDVLRKNQKNIFLIEDETSPCDVSSTRIRRAIRRGESVKYCLEDAVIEYIEEHRLYANQSDFVAPSSSSEFESQSNGSATSSTSSVRTIHASPGDESKPICNHPSPPTRKDHPLTLPIDPTVDNIMSSSDLCSPVWKTPPTSSECSSKENSRETSIQREADEQNSQNQRKTKHSPSCAVYAHVRKTFQAHTLEKANGRIGNGQPTVKREEGSTVGATVGQAVTKDPNCQPASPKEHRQRLPPPLLPPPQLPSSAFMKPILSQHQLYVFMANEPLPSADSPLPLPPKENNKSPRLPLPPNKQKNNNNGTNHINSLPKAPPTSFASSFPPPMESPLYDNVTLDELLVASTSWAEYMADQSKKFRDEHTHDRRMPSPPPPLAEREKEKEKKDKKKGWFFNRSRSLKDPKEKPTSPSDDESLIRICGSDRRHQTQTSPEILWRKISQIGGNKERWSDLPPSPKKSTSSRGPSAGRSPEKHKKDQRNLRFAQQLTKSAENVHQMAPPPSVMSRSCHEGGSDEGVTLTFRRYRLTATPETTV